MSLTVRENVLAPAILYGAASSELQQRAEALLDRVGIRHLEHVYPGELSGGEQRRMAIARALIGNPGIVFADEPTSSLDEENTQTVLRLLREAADEGRAVLLVTHETDALAYADVSLQMRDGRLGERA